MRARAATVSYIAFISDNIEQTTHPSISISGAIATLQWKSVAAGALKRIDQKLDGVFLPWRDPRFKHHPQTKELPTDTLVDMLIREATNKTHLVW